MTNSPLQIGDFVWSRMFGLTIRFQITSELTITNDEGIGYYGSNPICPPLFVPSSKIVQHGFEWKNTSNTK